MPLRNRSSAAAISIIAVFAIGWLDLETGRDIGLSLFYLVPVAVCGWYAGRRAAILVAVAASIVWFGADLPGSPSIPISVWNGFSRLVIYVSQAWMMAKLRSDRDELRLLVHAQAALARTDHATNLPNARAFLETLDYELERVDNMDGSLSLVYIDLDNFKTINDRFGHTRGDDVLQRVGEAIVRAVRGQDIAARIGGDEFAVLLRGVQPEVAKRVGLRIVDHIRSIGNEYPDSALGATVGIAHYRSAPATAAELLRSADSAMYTGKEAGKGCVIVREYGEEESVA